MNDIKSLTLHIALSFTGGDSARADNKPEILIPAQIQSGQAAAVGAVPGRGGGHGRGISQGPSRSASSFSDLLCSKRPGACFVCFFLSPCKLEWKILITTS